MWLKILRDNAKAFKKSGDKCIELFMNGEYSLGVPAVVNLAFSIELYLKFLFAEPREQTPPKEHNLLKLFRLLDSVMQDDIIKMSNYDKDEFESLLKKHSSAFIEWRYVHDTDGDMLADFKFMKNLIDSIESIVKQIDALPGE
jgi:HEPN domain-containing protein